MDFEGFIKGLQGWADLQEDIRAVIVIGSRARTEKLADEWSDLDVVGSPHITF